MVYKRSVDIICNMDTRGRYVIIQIPGALEILTLCEVQVFEGSEFLLLSIISSTKYYHIY